MSLTKNREFEWSDWAKAIFLLLFAGVSGSGTSLLFNRPQAMADNTEHDKAIAKLESTDIYVLQRLDRIESKLDKIYEATRNNN